MFELVNETAETVMGWVNRAAARFRWRKPKPYFIPICVRSPVTHVRMRQIEQSADWHRRDREIAFSLRDGARVRWNMERLDALANETIDLLGYQDDEFDESEICRDMVYFGISQEETLEKLMRMKL